VVGYNISKGLDDVVIMYLVARKLLKISVESDLGDASVLSPQYVLNPPCDGWFFCNLVGYNVLYGTRFLHVSQKQVVVQSIQVTQSFNPLVVRRPTISRGLSLIRRLVRVFASFSTRYRYDT
jgi:hypothetical protein